mmetsp:Transcript_9029/g.13610  ORF Transcript_9029/g.13610 Transcript_9029/m.13610 type:complete len:342 (+) Transcript_9029:81-1106(+)|eukprot:CAMPEP_0196133810 /NCGR_PEP_ID=MMETSP0910-20130528/2867_1 /TAXON_ID=49265 /ORGANISM="Thalassiosira rotula, Strain GSO102" /LENGTH=341 /DNA_ID=CAMNT_0041393561 /DNA_START=325 /DNA_END=1350 /DNA_ORIENTATION=-
MGFFNTLKNQAIAAAKEGMLSSLGVDADGTDGEQMTKSQYEESKPDELRKDVRMISGCQDKQTSADVSNVEQFELPDPAGRAGGACTSTLLRILYADEKVPEEDLSFAEVVSTMREQLAEGNYTQVPQLSSMNPIDLNAKFDLVPESATGTRRAVMIGINYVGDRPGELSGCHNDVHNMKKYIMDVHGFEEENIRILMDDGENEAPTRSNIIAAYKAVIAEAEEGDAIFLHYSGHGTKLRDQNGDEADGYDEALCPRDFQQAGMIRDDDLYDILVKGLPNGVHMVSLMDCCHSGSIMDLPYIFKGDGSQTEMELDPEMNLDAFIECVSGKLVEFLKKSLGL